MRRLFKGTVYSRKYGKWSSNLNLGGGGGRSAWLKWEDMPYLKQQQQQQQQQPQHSTQTSCTQVLIF